MAEAAAVQEQEDDTIGEESHSTTSEESHEELSEVTSEPEEMPDFEIFKDDGSEAETEAETETEAAPEAEEPAKKSEPKKANDTWSARVRKDRELRQREIQFKRREQELSGRESRVNELEGARESILKDPNAFFKSVGLDPLKFYQDWSERLATGSESPSSELQLSSTQQELKELKEQLSQRDEKQKAHQLEAQRDQVIQAYDAKIAEYKKDFADEFPLTAKRCSVEDIREGMVTYYQQTGVELGFREAFDTIEQGLAEEERKAFDDPLVMARFRKHHNLQEAANNSGVQASRTLSSSMKVPPTKKSPEDMTHDEIITHYSGKLFT
ncbi:MAG: hypothetical protein CL489_11975 [Acidobacteria bacterium]|nr:hypothetical protein [Acidobacteriota bacterium]